MSLYPAEGAHWWSEADYNHVREVTRRLAAKRVLEFGPGTSTLSLVDGGAQHIDACEDDPHWFEVHTERLAVRYPDIIHMRPYRWRPVPCILGVDGQRYDLGLIDGPAMTEHRAAVMVYAMAHCQRVLVPLEETPEETGQGFMRGIVHRFARLFGRSVEVTDTGPLAGSFALIGPPC